MLFVGLFLLSCPVSAKSFKGKAVKRKFRDLLSRYMEAVSELSGHFGRCFSSYLSFLLEPEWVSYRTPTTSSSEMFFYLKSNKFGLSVFDNLGKLEENCKHCGKKAALVHHAIIQSASSQLHSVFFCHASAQGGTSPCSEDHFYCALGNVFPLWFFADIFLVIWKKPRLFFFATWRNSCWLKVFNSPCLWFSTSDLQRVDCDCERGHGLTALKGKLV